MEEKGFIKKEIATRLEFLNEEVEEHQANVENYTKSIKECKELISDYRKEIKYLKGLKL